MVLASYWRGARRIALAIAYRHHMKTRKQLGRDAAPGSVLLNRELGLKFQGDGNQMWEIVLIHGWK
jgi:hypothetical protein